MMQDWWRWISLLLLAVLALSLACNFPFEKNSQGRDSEDAETPSAGSENIPLPDDLPLSDEQTARLKQALHSEVEDQRSELLRLLGRPDAFSLVEVLVEDEPVRRESWFYFRYLTRIDLVDGQAVMTVDLEETPVETIFPAWYDPLTFPKGMSGREAIQQAGKASPAGAVPTQIDSSGLGEELAGGEMWVGDQIVLGIFDGRLVYVETVPLFPEEVQ
ncbi:MAG: hypothetical protein JXA42_21890 [Anaerolineales bacterium]|nr:hypothetical protein [Anaerolineales bacterium]